MVEIKKLEHQLLLAIQEKEEEFAYTIKGKKVYFEEEAKRYQKTLVTKIPAYLMTASLRNILTAPIIWACLIPAVVMDVAVTVYQSLCFRIYNIPRVRRDEYIVIDRHRLAYLNPIEKLNCLYCGYFNGLMAYMQEIGARTEQYWCPIKHARKLAAIHSRYHKFLEYGDCQDYQQKIEEIRKDFSEVQEEQPPLATVKPR